MIEKSGAWYSYNGEKIGQGRDKTLEYIAQNPEFAAELETKLRAVMFPPKDLKSGETPTVEQ